MSYRDRTEAGRDLARYLSHYANRNDVVVFALPRGGVPVAYEVARQLHAPLDAYTVRKLGLPGHEELAMGAIASDGSYVVDEAMIELAAVSREEFLSVVERELIELRRREQMYRAYRPLPDVRDKTVIVIDDGLATGSTMAAAVKALRTRAPAKIVIAVPVGAPETCSMLRVYADELVCVHSPPNFRAVGLHYQNFTQVTDAEVRALLAHSAELESKQWKVA